MVNNFARVTGGADRQCFDLAAELRERGHEVLFLATEDPRNIERAGRFVSCGVTRENRDDLRGLAAARVASRTLWNREAAGAMRRLAKEFAPDVVHVHKVYPQLSVAPIVEAHRLGLRVVQTVHDYELISASELDHRGSWLDRRESSLRYRVLNDSTFPIRRFVYAPRVARWVAVSRRVAEHLSARGINAEVIPNFVEPLREAPPERDRDGVAYIGRLASEKGVEDVLAAATRLPEIRFTVAGDGPLANEVTAATSRTGNLEFRGRIDRSQVADLIAGSRAVLMPSRWEEPGPLSALEAMSLGTPVIAYRNGGLAEYVDDAGAGVVIEPSLADLVGAIAELASGGERWGQFATAGRAAVAARHSPGRCVSMYEQVYEGAPVTG